MEIHCAHDLCLFQSFLILAFEGQDLLLGVALLFISSDRSAVNRFLQPPHDTKTNTVAWRERTMNRLLICVDDEAKT